MRHVGLVGSCSGSVRLVFTLVGWWRLLSGCGLALSGRVVSLPGCVLVLSGRVLALSGCVGCVLARSCSGSVRLALGYCKTTAGLETPPPILKE